MNWSRRHFLKSALASGAAAGVLVNGSLGPNTAEAAFKSTKNRNRLKILILGGTAFLGPHIVEDALGRGHEVTLFNRGRTNPHLFPDLEKFVGRQCPPIYFHFHHFSFCGF